MTHVGINGGGIVGIVSMSAFSWQGQKLCFLSSAFIIDWRSVTILSKPSGLNEKCHSSKYQKISRTLRPLRPLEGQTIFVSVIEICKLEKF